MSSRRKFEHTATRIDSSFGKIIAANGIYINDGIVFKSEYYTGIHEIFHSIGRDIFHRLGVSKLPRPFSASDEAITLTIQSIFKGSELITSNGTTLLKMCENPESFRGVMSGFFDAETDGFYNVVSKEYTAFAIKKLFPGDENGSFTETEKAIKNFLQSGIKNSVIHRLNTLNLEEDNFPNDLKNTCDFILENIPSWIKNQNPQNLDGYLLFEVVNNKNDDLYSYYLESESYTSSMKGASSLRIKGSLSEHQRIKIQEKINTVIRYEKALEIVKKTGGDVNKLRRKIHLTISEIEPHVHYYYGLSRF